MSTVEEAPRSDLTDSATIPGGVVDPTPFLISAEMFHRMLATDLFDHDARVELWDGRIYEKMAKNKPHSMSGARVMYTLFRVTPAGWFIWPENPVTIGPKRVPLPDYALLRGALDDYQGRDPIAADVGLVVELADTSLRHDTGAKLAGYAEANIPTYWVVNLVANVVQAYDTPIPAERRYGRMQTFAAGQAVPLHLDGMLIAEVPAADLLPFRT